VLPSSIIENNLRFAGQVYDEETMLHYNYHRYFDQISGRYLRQDILRPLAGQNIYLYVVNNPLNLIDPFGLEPWNMMESYNALYNDYQSPNFPIEEILESLKTMPSNIWKDLRPFEWNLFKGTKIGAGKGIGGQISLTRVASLNLVYHDVRGESVCVEGDGTEPFHEEKVEATLQLPFVKLGPQIENGNFKTIEFFSYENYSLKDFTKLEIGGTVPFNQNMDAVHFKLCINLDAIVCEEKNR